jgi:hypothetical protein
MKKLLLLILPIILIGCNRDCDKPEHNHDMEKTISIIEQVDKSNDVLDVKNMMLKELAESSDSVYKLLSDKDMEIHRLEMEQRKERYVTEALVMIPEPVYDIAPANILEPIVMFDTIYKVIEQDTTIFIYDTISVLITDTISIPNIDSTRKNLRIYRRINKLLEKLK